MDLRRCSAGNRTASAVVLAFLTLISTSGLLAAEEISMTSVQAAAERYVRDVFSGAGDVKVGEVRLSELGDLEGRNLTVRPRLGRPADAPGPVLVSLEFWAGDERAGQRTVSVDVEVFREVLVAEGTLDRHTLIAEEDVRLERRNVRTAHGSCFTTADDLVGRWTRRIIPAGEPILVRDVEEVPMIKRGEKVVVVVTVGGVTVRASGVALEDGAAGDEIAVKNERSGKRLSGVVAGEGLVEVRLPAGS